MKLRNLLFAAALIISLRIDAAEPGKIVVATVNIDALNSQIGYENFTLLNVDEDTKATLAKLKADKLKLQQELLKATDDLTLRKINESLQFIRNKQDAIRTSMSRNRTNDYRQVLNRFIKERFGKKYPMILIAGYSDWKNRAIQFDVEEVDITDKVAEEFLKEYGSN